MKSPPLTPIAKSAHFPVLMLTRKDPSDRSSRFGFSATHSAPMRLPDGKRWKRSIVAEADALRFISLKFIWFPMYARFFKTKSSQRPSNSALINGGLWAFRLYENLEIAEVLACHRMHQQILCDAHDHKSVLDHRICVSSVRIAAFFLKWGDAIRSDHVLTSLFCLTCCKSQTSISCSIQHTIRCPILIGLGNSPFAIRS
jgi:hypothetical protein